ncbi:ShlB/FhaC/HecB family hemolysin secretion/activation protein [Microcoleus sp. FACHB-672]|uniref:ShlB/FhaC/HecB family hemolysin secretion/activation protein n=1 Tax=Microcoleus sp. FACHB-672 TaxID=2692825 RepID=UPI0016835F61|nr:ShlB/FhaC/HecB family hemolysin secretion/activation protein [Microcoleus sp. FACHB-672]MBD2041285.1 ShlB/FhaC/HecB family hemolysin secretion/activation protein [Microcoleus sp. FACHB-672]
MPLKQNNPIKSEIKAYNLLYCCFFAFSFYFVLTAGELLAQPVDPPQVPLPLPRPQEPTPLPTPELLPPPEELLQPPTTPAPPQQLVPDNVPGNIQVERFEFEGNTAFSDERLRQVLDELELTGRALTFAELLQARSAITKLYTDEGFITSGALIPPQTLDGGVVIIQIVEGELEDINVAGTNRLNDDYIRSRIGIATRRPLNVNKLLESLQLLQLNPLIATVSAELSAGSRAGSSLLDVTVTEANSFSHQLTFDNGRTPSVGSFRRQINLNEGNVLGLGDGLNLAYTNTDGSNAFDGSYTLPFNARNGAVTFAYSRSSSNIIEPPFDQVDIEARSRNYEVSVRQPLILTPTREFALGLSANRQESDTTLLNVPFPLSPGANEQGQTRINAIRFFQDWTQRDAQQVFAARSQFSLGIGERATVNEEPPDSRFFAWRGQAQWLRQFAPDTLLLVRGDVQMASRALLPLEQFGLGGIESVRGYRQDALLSDNGAFASAEIRIPIYRLPNQQGVLQVAPFIDIGTTWNSSGREAPDPNTLVSAGLGLRFQFANRLTARIDYGIPLVDINSSNRTWQENGLYFSIVTSPF